MLGVAVIEVLAVNDVAFDDGEPCGAQHVDLLGLVVVDRRLSGKRVEVVVREGFLHHLGRRRRHGKIPSRFHFEHVEVIAHAVEIAGHQLKLRVVERRAAAVDHRHPAVDVRGLVVARHGEHVIRIPGQLAGKI